MNKSKLREKDFCTELYVQQNKTIEEIGIILNCVGGTVRYWLQKHNIPRRKASHKIPNYKNKRFGQLEALDYTSNGHSRVWRCKCDCGNIVYIESSNLRRGALYCKDCKYKNLGNIHWKGFEEIPYTIFGKIKHQAKKRNLKFDITIEQIWNLFIKQKRKCVLSGLDIKFANKIDKKWYINTTASLDRIDSSKGYTIDNVQWIHKDINIMKNKYKQEYFIQICKQIATLYSPEVKEKV